MKVLFNPKTFTGKDLDPETRALFFKTIDWFEKKGLNALKQDDMHYRWYDDFIRFQKEEKLFATLLTPSGYGKENSCYDLKRITRFNELLAFYSMAHRYVFQVSILGTGPIWMSDNEAVKKRTAALLQQGAIFGFGVSEKEHGADLYSNETFLTPCGDGTYKANGNKYYIGNSNKGYISTIGKIPETGEYVFFQVDSNHRNYNDQKRIVTLSTHCAYVGQYELVEYPITDDDIISRGDKALEDALKTVNIGKFQVGVVPVGCCTHIGIKPTRTGNHHPFLVPFGMFTGNDGSVIIGAPNPKLWMMLCNVMGKSEIAKDPLFATGADRLKNLDKLKVLISESGF